MRTIPLKAASVVALAAMCLLWVANPAYAAPAGLLDPNWGTAGTLTEHLGSIQKYCSYPGGGSYNCGPQDAVDALDAHDGRVYMASPFDPSNGLQQVAVVAYLPSGAHDPTFGTGGAVWLDAAVNAEDMSVSHITLQPGPGATEYLGWYDTAGAKIVRLEPDGHLDPTFGTGGVVTLPATSGTNQVNWMPMVAGADGSLTVAFSTFSSGFALQGLVRFRPDGTKDPAFGVGGVAASLMSAGSALPPSALAVAGDGRVFEVLGSRNGPFGYGEVLALTSHGQVDTGFGTQGIAHPFANEPIDAIAVDASGRLLVMTSIAFPDFHAMLAITRLRADGTADPTFGVGGTFGLAAAGVTLMSSQLAIDASGRPVATFTYYDGRRTLAGILRLTPSGRLDTTFGPDPGTGMNLWRYASFTALAVGSDGRLYTGSAQFASGFSNVVDMHILAVVDTP